MVLILVVVEDGLVLMMLELRLLLKIVLILVVVEDGLVLINRVELSVVDGVS